MFVLFFMSCGSSSLGVGVRRVVSCGSQNPTRVLSRAELQQGNENSSRKDNNDTL
jgi:hypothetical protein